MMNEELRRMFRNPTSLSNRLLLYIGLHQDEGITYLSSIARALKVPETTLNYHSTKFKGGGLILSDNSTKNIIKLTDLGLKVFKYLWDNSDKTILRTHNLQVVFEVIKGELSNPNHIYEPFTNKKYKGIKTKYNGFTFMCYGKKVVAVLPDIYADDDETISSEIQLIVKEVKKVLESEFNLVLGTTKIATIQRMHIAVLNSNIAKRFLKKGFTEENDEFAIDKSHGIPEVEITNKDNALKDIKELIKLDTEVKNEK